MGVSIPLAQAAVTGQLVGGQLVGGRGQTTGQSGLQEPRPLTAPATFLPNMGLISTERAEIWAQLSARDKVSALLAGRAADDQVQVGAPVYGRTPNTLTDRTGFAVTAYLGLFDGPVVPSDIRVPDVPKLTQPGFLDVDLKSPSSVNTGPFLTPPQSNPTGGGAAGLMEMSGPYSAVDRRFPGDMLDFLA
ncbi:MAG: hypothetical protein AAF556_05650 [Pseudomonadota bacterium]